MKVRAGFVSNSSSSSFCILGKDFDLNDFTYEERKEFKEAGLDVHEGYEECGLVIGKYPNELDEGKTIAQHKKEIANLITQITGVETEVSEIFFLDDGGYDG